MRLIDADALHNSLRNKQKWVVRSFYGEKINEGYTYDQVHFAIDDAPTVDAVERKKGKWVDGQCSECGCDVPAYIIDWKWQKDMDAKFCPMCGAKMKQC